MEKLSVFPAGMSNRGRAPEPDGNSSGARALADARICLYPFSRIELGHRTFVPCCGDWLTPEYFEIETGDDPWNGPAAQELRARIRRGDYSLCRRDICHVQLKTIAELEKNPRSLPETPLSPANLQAMKRGETKLPDGPVSVSLITDPRCNLACPSCRPDYIFVINDRVREKLESVERFLSAHAENIEVVKMAGNGEVFFSPWLRALLKSLTRENFPRLDYVTILSNGLLMNEKNMQALRPGSDFIKRVMISIDAGDEETYRAVRGGDWKKLMANLGWASEKRREGRFTSFIITFVTRRANYRTIPQFIALGRSLGVDSVHFAAFVQWPHISTEDYRAEAVHLPGHPEHGEFKAIFETCRKDPLAFFSITVKGA